MTIETVKICPLGSKCEEIKDGKIYECVWHIQLAGVNPNTGERVDNKGCAMAWIPILLVENSSQQRATSMAVESFREETMKANELNLQIIALGSSPNVPMKTIGN